MCKQVSIYAETFANCLYVKTAFLFASSFLYDNGKYREIDEEEEEEGEE